MLGAFYNDGVKFLASLVAAKYWKLEHGYNRALVSSDAFERLEDLYERLKFGAEIAYRPLIVSEGIDSLM